MASAESIIIEGGAHLEEWPVLLALGDLLPLRVRLAAVAVGGRRLNIDSSEIDRLLERSNLHCETAVIELGSSPIAWRWYVFGYLSGLDRGNWVVDLDSWNDDTSPLGSLLIDLHIVRNVNLRANTKRMGDVRMPVLAQVARILSGMTDVGSLSCLAEVLSYQRAAALALLADNPDGARAAIIRALSAVERPTLSLLRQELLPQLLLIRLQLEPSGATRIAIAQNMRQHFAGTKSAGLIESWFWHAAFDAAAEAGGFLVHAPNYPIYGRETAVVEHFEVLRNDAAYSLGSTTNDSLYLIDQGRVLAASVASSTHQRQLGRLRASAELKNEAYADALASYAAWGEPSTIERDVGSVSDSAWPIFHATAAASMKELIRHFGDRSNPYRRTNLAVIMKQLLLRRVITVEVRAQLLPDVLSFGSGSRFQLLQNANDLTPVFDGVAGFLDQAAPIAVEAAADSLAAFLVTHLQNARALPVVQQALRTASTAMLIDGFSRNHGQKILETVVGLLASVPPGYPWPLTSNAFHLLSSRPATRLLSTDVSLLSRARVEVQRHLAPDTTLAQLQADLVVRAYDAMGLLDDATRDSNVDRVVTRASNPELSDALESLRRLLSVRDRLSADNLDEITKVTTTLLKWRSHDGGFVCSVQSAALVTYVLAQPEQPHPSQRALSTLFGAVLELLSDARTDPRRLWPQLGSYSLGIANWTHAALDLAKTSRARQRDMEALERSLGAIAAHDPEAAAGVYRARLEASRHSRQASEVPLSTAEAFYTSLPRFLADGFAPQEELRGLRRLLAGVQAFGPHAADIGVFTAALRSSVFDAKERWSEYTWRLRALSTESIHDTLRTLIARLTEHEPAASVGLDIEGEGLERLRMALADVNEAVELDVEEPHVSADESIAAELARKRVERLERGDRVARVVRSDALGRVVRVYEAMVSRVQARALLAGGARWVGPEDYRPQ